MLPRDAAKKMITIYNYLPESKTFHRAVLHDCSWALDKSSSMDKYGTAVPDNIRIEIPYDYKYFSTQCGDVFTGRGWTVQLGPELQGSYIVKGECRFIFPHTADEQSMEDYIRTVVIPFEEKRNPYRPKQIEEHMIGSRNLWSIEVTV